MEDYYTELCEIARIMSKCRDTKCDDCKMPVFEGTSEYGCVDFIRSVLPKIADAIEALQASAAEKDKRIAELQAENESIRDILFDGDGTNLVNYWYQQTQIAENGCRNYADENARLQAENGAMEEHITKLLDDIERIDTEPSTEYMRGIKYAIYEIMKEADIRGSQEIRDSGDSDDEMCAVVGAKIRDEIDGAVNGLFNRLQAERDAAVAVSIELRDDFVSYVTDGVSNVSPYCVNKTQECTDGRGWCITEKCVGFLPSAWHGVREGEI